MKVKIKEVIFLKKQQIPKLLWLILRSMKISQHCSIGPLPGGGECVQGLLLEGPLGNGVL